MFHLVSVDLVFSNSGLSTGLDTYFDRLSVRGQAMQYPILLTIFGFWHIPIAVMVFQLTEALMLQEAESKIRERDSRIQMMLGEKRLYKTYGNG